MTDIDRDMLKTKLRAVIESANSALALADSGSADAIRAHCVDIESAFAFVVEAIESGEG